MFLNRNMYVQMHRDSMSNGLALRTAMPRFQEKVSCLQTAAYSKTAITRSRVRARCQTEIVKDGRREAEFTVNLNSVMRRDQDAEVIGAPTVAQQWCHVSFFRICQRILHNF